MYPDYDYLDDQLTQADIKSSAAEVQGLLCGLLCAGEKHLEQRLFAELTPDPERKDPPWGACRESLEGLAREIRKSISGEHMGFSLLLPDDGKPLQERAAAVRDWCQGFLYGMGLTEGGGDRELSAEAQEALEDLAEMTRMQVEDLGDSEEEETALAEVVEFIWVAATLVHDELAPIADGS